MTRLAVVVLVLSMVGLWGAAGVDPELLTAPPATTGTVVAEAPAGGDPPTTVDTVAASTIPVSEHALVDGADEAAADAPVRLGVAVIDLEVEVVGTGVDDEGQFAVPAPDLVGWYEHGPVPGEAGSAVLAAHVDWNRRPGAFSDLALLEPGHTVEVGYASGATRTFVVVEQVLYDKAALPATELFREDGAAVVRLITCGGAFDRAAGHYLGNRVVTAVEVDAER